MSRRPPEKGAGGTSTAAAKTRQLALDLDLAPGFSAEDYVIGSANASAFKLTMDWPDWPHSVVLLHGAAGCGKSHLAHIWAAHSGATEFGAGGISRFLPGLIASGHKGRGYLVEDIDRKRLDEDGLFHLINHTIETGGALLATARVPRAQLGVGLADLVSRLRAAGAAEILQPDIELLETLLVKLFADRQIDVSPQVTAFAANRMERSFAAAAALVKTVDRWALEDGRSITIPLLRRYFGEDEGAD